LRFITYIKNAVRRGERVYIDFSPTTKMVADGTLLFWAELHKLHRDTPGRKRIVGCRPPSDDVVDQVLQQVGIYNILGKRRQALVVDDTVKYWKSESDTTAVGKKIEAVQRIGPLPDVKTMYYKGISEAMTNCVQWAYPDDNPTYKGESRWWMFSEERDGMRSVALCDLGIGIPTSIRQSNKWRPFLGTLLAKIGLGDSDAAVIKAAFEIGVSLSEQPTRGKGLDEVRKVLDAEEMGSLYVLSGHGRYTYSADTKQEATHNFTDTSPGTLIGWKSAVRK
jgi:hypothetical protein